MDLRETGQTAEEPPLKRNPKPLFKRILERDSGVIMPVSFSLKSFICINHGPREDFIVQIGIYGSAQWLVQPQEYMFTCLVAVLYASNLFVLFVPNPTLLKAWDYELWIFKEMLKILGIHLEGVWRIFEDICKVFGRHFGIDSGMFGES